MTALPVIFAAGDLQIADPDTGETLVLRAASDRAIAHAAEKVAALDSELCQAKRALAAELRNRHGIGTISTGGYQFKITEAQSWPLGATEDALRALVARGAITEPEMERAMPAKPKPNAALLKSLAGRLAVSDPEAAKILADACTISPPSVRDIQPVAAEATAETVA